MMRKKRQNVPKNEIPTTPFAEEKLGLISCPADTVQISLGVLWKARVSQQWVTEVLLRNFQVPFIWKDGLPVFCQKLYPLCPFN